MKRIISLIAIALVAICNLPAQKTVYIPNEWKNPWPSDSLLYAESDPDNQYTWSKSRSVESDNVIVFWDKGYGAKKPSESASPYKVDEQDLLQKCEAFYDLEINKLGFVDPETSNLAKYKVMVLLNHTTDWVCYGGGYDYMISALWLGPSACAPVGHSVAHEVGHSFHYMCYAEHSGHKDSQTDNTGFHLACGNGQAIWEQTAQWQAAQSYPSLMFSQSYPIFGNSHNLAFSHEWHRYQSYWFHYFLCQYYNDITTVAQVWNQPMTKGQTSGNGTDFNQALMELKGLDANGLYRLYYEYAARCATWDLDVCKSYRNAYIGNFHYAAVITGEHQYQVAMESVPQSSGFNVIPLSLPETGTDVRVTFCSLKASYQTPLADGDPGLYLNGEAQWAKSGRTKYYSAAGGNSNKGFRLGFVALMNDNTRRYFHEDSVYCKGEGNDTARISMNVPEGVKQMWMIVSPAPSRYYKHLWDEKFNSNDDNWPYTIAFEGTDIDESRATIYAPTTIDGRDIDDVTLTYDVYMPKRSAGDYTAVGVTVKSLAAAAVGTAFQMQPSEIADRLVTYSSSGPQEGEIMFYSVNPKTLKTVNRGSTANGYGHWFSSTCNVTDFGSGYIYSEFQPTSFTFNIGEKAENVTSGNTYTINQALVYNNGTKKATAIFTFRVHIQSGSAYYELADIATDIATPYLQPKADGKAYDLSGRRIKRPTAGLYIKDGRVRLGKR